jgi:hypothetical protein
VAVPRQVHLGSISRLSIIWQGITQDPHDLGLMSRSGTFRTGRRGLSVIMTNWCGDLIGVCHIGACHGLVDTFIASSLQGWNRKFSRFIPPNSPSCGSFLPKSKLAVDRFEATEPTLMSPLRMCGRS